MTDSALTKAANAISDSIIADRRDIHQFPELAYHEERTSAKVAERLRVLGIDTRTGLAQTGVVGVIEGSGEGKTVLLRADMDALAMQETGEVEYKSRNDGVMHACGHDGHTAMLLGAAKLLQDRRDSFKGRVKLMFQPAEEGGAGALRMIEDGLLEDPSVDAGFALHVTGILPAGHVWVSDDNVTASSDRFTITVRAHGGHAASPHLAVDPVVVSAHIVTALQTLVSREADPLSPAVVTIGQLTAGTTSNVIPDTAVMRGTVRTYSTGLQDQLELRISELARGIAMAMRAEAEVEYVRMYPPTVNHPAEAQLMRDSIAATLGDQANVSLDPLMGGEDFSFVLQKVPGAFGMIGVRKAEWREPKVNHNAAFDMDEDVLPLGTAVLASTALRFLGAES